MHHDQRYVNRWLKLYLRILKTIFFNVLFFYSTIVWGQNHSVSYNPAHLNESLQRFSFAVLGDRTGAGPDSWAIMDRAIDELNQLRPDFIVFIGDIIEGQTPSYKAVLNQWNEADGHFSKIRAPLFMVPGNHDIWDGQSYRMWQERVGRPYFSFNYNGCHFLIINTEESSFTGRAGFGDSQMAFILRDISENRQVNHFYVFMHEPVWLLSGAVKTQWVQIENKLDGLDYMVVAGHIHLPAAGVRNGRRFFINGPTGGRMRFPRNPEMGLFQQYSWITVDRDTTTIALIEPGSVHHEETARKAYKRYMQGLFLLKGKNW